MSRILTSQSNDKIPAVFHKLPVPEAIRNLLIALDQKYTLSHGEVEWLLESLDSYHGFTTGHDISNLRWDNLEKNLGQVMSWSRTTEQSVLRTTLPEAYKQTKTYFLDKSVEQAFSNNPSAVKFLKNVSDDIKKGYVQLNGLIDGGLSDDEFKWVALKGAKGSQMDAEGFQRQIATIVKWSRATGTSLSTMNDFGTAHVMAREWEDYFRQSELAKRLSKNGIKKVNLSGKWKAVWIDPDAVALLPTSLTENGQNVDESETYEYQIEHRITGIHLSSGNKLISIRDPNGVPQASIAFDFERDDHIEVYATEGTSQGKLKIKELVAKLGQAGQKMWWAGDPTEASSIKELTEVVYDVNGFVPLVSLPRIGTIESENGYKEALDWVYGEAWGGSQYYESLAKRGVAALVDYAEQRNALHLLEIARDRFDETANDSWFETEEQLQSSGVLERRPSEDDDIFNQNGEFDGEAFDAALTAYDEAADPHRDAHEPTALAQYAYELLQATMNKPENKPFYDELDRQQQLANQKAERERQEKARIRLQEEEEARNREKEELRRLKEEENIQAGQAAVNRLITNPPMSGDIEFSDEDELFAFNIGWKKTSMRQLR